MTSFGGIFSTGVPYDQRRFVDNGARSVEPFMGQVRFEVHALPTSHEPSIFMPVFRSDKPTTRSVTDCPGPLSNPVARFHPPHPDDLPTDLFAPESSLLHPNARYVRRSNYKEILIYTDGACSNNGQPDAQAGWAFVFHPSNPNANVRHRVERCGVDGKEYPQTSNRAELRAVLGALDFRAWESEAIRIVIATDSEYVVLGATEWVTGWRNSGWRTSDGKPVKNRDLWERLMERIEEIGLNGTQTLFWRIPRELNSSADGLAKEAAALTDVRDRYIPHIGVLV